MSPRLLARTDFNKHPAGAKEMLNCFPLPHGGADGRGGFRLAAEVRNHDMYTRVYQFEFSTEQSYIIEFGNFYARFYKDEGRIESPPGTPVEIATPYAVADVEALKFSQSADTLYITHRSYQTRKLTRTSHTSWTLTATDFVDGPYLDQNTTTTTITPSVSGVGASGTLTASSGIFQSGHVGALFRLFISGSWGYVKVTGYNSSTSVNMTVVKSLGGTTATAAWREGAFSPLRGYPGAVTIFEQRLILAGTKAQPQTVFGSASGSYEDMTPGTGDADAFIYTIGSNKVNSILWMVGDSRLTIGTIGEEFVMSGGSAPITPSNVRALSQTVYGSADVQGIRIGSSTVFVQRSRRKVRQLSFSNEENTLKSPDLTLLSEHITQSGVSAFAYQQEPDSILWCVRKDGLLSSLTFLQIQDVTGWARHQTDGVFESVAVIPSLSGEVDTLWAVVRRTIGGVTKRYVEFYDPSLRVDSGLSYDGTVNSDALTLSAVSGASITATTPGAVFVAGDVGKDIVLTGTTLGRARITSYVSPTQVLCTGVNTFPATTFAAGAWGIAAATVSGLSHLEGKTVKIVGDGAVYPEQTVVAGTVELDGLPALKVDVGLEYIPRLVTVEPEVKGQDSSTIQSIRKRLARAFIRVYETSSLWINGVPEVPARTTTHVMGVAPPEFTGDIQVSNLGYEARAVLTIEQRNPKPMTVLGIWGDLEYGD